MKKRDAYHPDYLTMYPCLKERPDILKFLKQCDRKQEYLEYDLKVNRTRTNKRTMETVIWPQRELSYEHLTNLLNRSLLRRRPCFMKSSWKICAAR